MSSLHYFAESFRPKIYLLLFLIALCGKPADSQGQTSAELHRSAANEDSFYLDLDTAAGSFSQWRKDDLGEDNSVVADVECSLIRKGSNYVAALSIRLQDRPDDAQNEIAVQMAAYDGKAPLRVKLVGRLQGQAIQPIDLQTEVKTKEVLKVKLLWDSVNTLTLNTGSETHKVHLSWKPKALAITGSTGEFKVHPLVLRVESESPHSNIQ